MTTPHTQGPWFLFNDDLCVGGLCANVQGGTAGIAICAMARRSIEENKANARLIVASPDLLSAAIAQHKTIDRLFARLITAGTGFMPSKSAEWAALAAGHTAILKAGGAL